MSPFCKFNQFLAWVFRHFRPFFFFFFFSTSKLVMEALCFSAGSGSFTRTRNNNPSPRRWDLCSCSLRVILPCLTRSNKQELSLSVLFVKHTILELDQHTCLLNLRITRKQIQLLLNVGMPMMIYTRDLVCHILAYFDLCMMTFMEIQHTSSHFICLISIYCNILQ